MFFVKLAFGLLNLFAEIFGLVTTSFPAPSSPFFSFPSLPLQGPEDEVGDKRALGTRLALLIRVNGVYSLPMYSMSTTISGKISPKVFWSFIIIVFFVPHQSETL